MNQKQNNLNLEPENYTTTITKMQFQHIDELFFYHYQMLKEQSMHVDRYDDPIRHKYLSLLTLKVLELWESITECAEEYDFLNLEGEA